MVKKRFLSACLLLTVIFLPLHLQAQPTTQVKISIFNFGAVNIEASGYGTTVTNMLTSNLITDPTLAMLDRKELESFLNLNDLQQNDDMDNVIQIGSRLGLDVIVVGTVEMREVVQLAPVHPGVHAFVRVGLEQVAGIHP